MASRAAAKEERGSSGTGKRSYLFLSMILLVWNSLATAERLFHDGFPGNPPAASESPASESPILRNELPEPSGPRKSALTARQKYLIGKQIDINKASKEEFDSLPGISDAMAAAIVAERERTGGFRSPEELTRVKGIKEKRLEKILPFLKKMENN